MQIWNLSDGQRIRWEPTTDLVCSGCREPFDLQGNPRESISMTNFMFDLCEPAETSIVLGHYWYLHKRCSRMDQWLRQKGVKVFWGWHDMSAVLGRVSFRFKHLYGDTQKILRKAMPPGCYDQLYANWLPALKPGHMPRPLQLKPLIAPRPPVLDRPGEVYIIEAVGSGRVKIGRGGKAETRLVQLSTGTPFPLKLIGLIETNTSIALEYLLHTRYAQYRKHGEWFELPQSVLDALLHESFT